MKQSHVDSTMMRIAYADKAERGEHCEHMAAYYVDRASKAYLAKKPQLYVGIKADAPYTVFASRSKPTFASHGDQFNAVIGPFRTKRGAEFMAKYGRGNPHCLTVDDAESLAKAAVSSH